MDKAKQLFIRISIFHKTFNYRNNSKSYKVQKTIMDSNIERRNLYSYSYRKMESQFKKSLAYGIGLSLLIPVGFVSLTHWKVIAKDIDNSDERKVNSSKWKIHGKLHAQKRKGKVMPILELHHKDGENDELRIKIDIQNFLSVLDQVGDRKFVIYSVNGSSRTGKSFLLNYFLRYFKNDKKSEWLEDSISEEFPWRSGVDRETVGIHLWSEPFFVKLENNEEIAVLLLDCQGLFDPQTTKKENAIIFTLSNLLSSVMIYNAMGKIDESILEDLQFHSNYAKAVTEEKSIDVEKLVVLFRDFPFVQNFSYGFHDKNGCPSSNAFVRFSNQGSYFHWFMNNSELPKENISVRKNIVENYNDLGFYLMPSPGKKFLSTSLHEDLDGEFKAYLKTFIEGLVKNPKKFIKRVGRVQMTGNEFKQYVSTWATFFEMAKDKLPDVQSISETTTKLQYESALRIAFEMYKMEFNRFIDSNKLGQSDEYIKGLHVTFSFKALQNFREKKKFGCKKYEEEYIEKLEATLNQEYLVYLKLNQQQRENANLLLSITTAVLLVPVITGKLLGFF